METGRVLRHDKIDIEPCPSLELARRLGLCVRAETGEGPRSLRIAFPRPAHTPTEARTVLVEMVRDARARA